MRISDWSSDVCSSDLPVMARAKKDTAAEDDAKASLLLRKAEDGYAFPALDSVANQFARSLRDLIRALGAPTVQVERGAAERVRFSDWCRDEDGRAHVCTPVTNAHLVCRVLREKK